MTLLAHARSDSEILVAADSAAVYIEGDEKPLDYGYTPHDFQRVHKIHQVDGRAMVWALCGSMGHVRGFREWMDSSPTEGWEQFSTQAGEKILELNQQAVRRAQAAKTKRRDIQQTSALVAGWMDDQPGVFTIEHTGEAFFPIEVGADWGFVGPYGGSARVAWQAVLACEAAKSLTDAGTMRAFMESVCLTIPGLRSPVDIWRITKEECAPVDP